MQQGRQYIGILLCAAVHVGTAAAPLSAAPEHRHEAAHEHGAASLGIVVEGKTVHFEFEAPAANIIGFEHEARSTGDRAKKKAALDKLTASISSILMFEASRGCKLSVETLDWKVETHGGSGTHSIVEGHFKAVCQKPVEGTSLRTAFTKFFPTLETVRTTVISGEKQNAVVIQNDKPAVEL